MTIDELHELCSLVEPVAVEGASVAHEARTFNDAVSRFREAVVRARNGIVLSQPVEPPVADQLRALARRLHDERRRYEPASELEQVRRLHG